MVALALVQAKRFEEGRAGSGHLGKGTWEEAQHISKYVTPSDMESTGAGKEVPGRAGLDQGKDCAV